MLSFFGWGSGSSKPPSSETPQQQTPTIADQPELPDQQQLLQLEQQPQPTQPKNKNLKLLSGGLIFLTLSLLLTRRAYRSRIRSTIPPYYTAAPYHKPASTGASDAVDALALATVNVLSFSMVATGGVAWLFDVDGVEDLRRVARAGFEGKGGGKDGGAGGESDEEVNEAIEAWVVSVLGRKGEGVVQRVREERGRGEEDG